jgi:hypothetical protein
MIYENGRPFDESYWGPDGPQPEKRWGAQCARGIQYAFTGAAAPSGTKGVQRKISTGRKSYRGMSSDFVKERA